MPKKKKFSRKIPPCPGDPEKYSLVPGRNGYYWRLKRGTIKPAVLNEALKRSAAITSTTNRAAKQMMMLLSSLTQHMDLGITVTAVAGAFKRAYLQGRMDFRFIHEIKFQENYVIADLFDGPVALTIEQGRLKLIVGVGWPHIKQPFHGAAEHYRVTAILLHGDPSKDNGLRISTDESDWYSIKEKKSIDCHLSLAQAPKNKPWMVLLHVICKMKHHVPPGPRYHAMWVVKAG